MSAAQKTLTVNQSAHCLIHLSPEAGESVSPHI
jgi:hypothetical protein